MNALLAAASSSLPQRPVLLVILAITYLAMAVGHVPGLKLDRTGIALLGAIAMMSLGGVSTAVAVSYVSWPTIMLLFGFFVISAQLRLSGLYHRIAGSISSHLGHPARFLLVLMAVTAGLSAVLNHDVVCLVFTPIVATAVLRQRLNPCPYLIALAISSNLGAAATLVGNPQNMMIGAVARLGFGRYVIWSAVPVLFALGTAYGIIWLLSRKTIGTPVPGQTPAEEPAVAYDRSHAVKGLIILGAVIALLFTSLPAEMVVLAAAGVHLASPKFRTADILRLVDWPVLVLFLGLFVVTGAFQAAGYGEAALRGLTRAGLDLHAPATLVLATTALSNLINNAAAVMLLLKVVDLSHPVTAYLLALANSFGGSLLIIGSVSNLIVVQQARSLGVDISFRAFARLGVPATLAALGGLLLWADLMK